MSDFTTKICTTVLLAGVPFATGTALAENLFPDKNLEAVVRQYVFEKKNNNEPLTEDDVKSLSTIKGNGKGITDLTGLEKCSSLASLDLADNEISQLSPIKELNNLQYLDLSKNNIQDAKPLGGLTGLQYLELSNNQLSDIAPLGKLDRLTSLYLSNNKIEDITALGELRKLWSLYLDGNQISDIRTLSHLKNLSSLDLRGNRVWDVSPLAGLTEFSYLFLDNNKITNIAPLVAMAKKDVQTDKRFAPFWRVYLTGNPLSASAEEAQIAQLKSFGSRVTFLPPVAFQTDRFQIRIGKKPFATYVLNDEEIPRPYFSDVRAPSGMRVTRNHPPIEGVDRTDHATFHPGLWLAFGDISSGDFWRNRARVRHVEFVEYPHSGTGYGKFAVRNHYEADGKVICEEVCHYTITVRPQGYLLIWDSQFSSNERDFVFGDQEEMGLGVRVATPLSVAMGGRITNSEGLKNEAQVWGKQAAWCDYSGTINRRRIGITLMSDPGNFRKSWFHARDYGLLLANPFGRNAFAQGEKSKVLVKKGEKLRLRFGVLIYSAEDEQSPDLDGAYRDFLQQIGHAR